MLFKNRQNCWIGVLNTCVQLIRFTPPPSYNQSRTNKCFDGGLIKKSFFLCRSVWASSLLDWESFLQRPFDLLAEDSVWTKETRQQEHALLRFQIFLKDANSKDGKLDFIMCTFHPIFGDNVRIIDTECNTTTLLNIFIDDKNLLFVWLEFFSLPWLGFPRPIPPKSIHPTLLLQPAILVVIISCNTYCHYFLMTMNSWLTLLRVDKMCYVDLCQRMRWEVAFTTS